MLVFSPVQLRSFADMSFIHRMKDVLHSVCEQSGMPVPPGLEEAIAEQLARARAHGFSDEPDCARWVLCAWCLGQDFDRKIASFSELLKRDDVGPAYKASAMEIILRSVFVALAGQSRNVL